MSSFRSLFYSQKAAQSPGWEARLMLSSYFSSRNPFFQSITTLQSLIAATYAQQVKIYPISSRSPEGYPPVVPWCQDESHWPLGTLLGNFHVVFLLPSSPSSACKTWLASHRPLPNRMPAREQAEDQHCYRSEMKSFQSWIQDSSYVC